MTDESVQASAPDDKDDWAFPNVDNFDDGLFSNEYQNESKDKPDPLQKEKDACNAASAELTQTKLEYDAKINLLNDMLTQLESSAEMMDDSLAEMLEEIIKKIVKKLIFRELDVDPKLMSSVILELKQLMQAKKSVVQVFLSEADFNNFDKDKLKASTRINLDASLSRGDVIIKSNTAEIWAILDERIEKLIEP